MNVSDFFFQTFYVFHIKIFQTFYVFQCNIGETVKALVEYISSGKPKLMLLGPGCSKAAFPVAEAAHYWNILQVCILLTCEQAYLKYLVYT